jgi:YMGG-like Gly-zipper
MFKSSGIFMCAAILTLDLLLAMGCNKKSESTAAPDNSAQAATPASESPQPVTSATPVPSFSAAQKVGVYVFPAKNQSRDQQLIDESECYDLAQQQSGVDPGMPAPRPPSSAEIQAAQAQGASSAPQAKGGRVRGAARGAAGGAMVGAIAGDAGTGAAVGATVGTMRGGMQQRRTNAAAKEQSAAQAGAQVQQQYEQQKATYNQQMANFKRAFSACLDSRGYSVK